MYPIGYVFLSLEDLVLQGFGYFVAFIIGVVSVLLAEVIMSRWRKPKITIETARSVDRLGFSISVTNKEVKHAKARCNNIGYPWENGKKVETKTLIVGDNPSQFFPYQLIYEETDDISKFLKNETRYEEKTSGILMTVRETTTNNIVYRYVLPSLPPRLTATGLMRFLEYTSKPQFDASIRIIGEGIDEVRDYSLHIGLNDILMPLMKESESLMDFVRYDLKREPLYRRLKKKLI